MIQTSDRLVELFTGCSPQYAKIEVSLPPIIRKQLRLNGALSSSNVLNDCNLISLSGNVLVVDEETVIDDLTNDDVMEGGLTIDRYNSPSNDFELGTAVAAEMTLKLNNLDGRFKNVFFEGSNMQVYFGVYVPEEDQIQYIKVGSFLVVDTPKRKSVMDIVALDHMVLLDDNVPSDFKIRGCTLKDIVERACTDCGVTLASDLSNFPNSSYVVREDVEEFSDMTFRDLIKDCAALMGKCIYMNPDGGLVFDWYHTTTFRVPADKVMNSDSYADYDYFYKPGKVSHRGKTGTVYYGWYSSKPKDRNPQVICTMDISSNQLVNFPNDEPLDSSILSKIEWVVGKNLHISFSVGCTPCPFIMPFDIIKVQAVKGGSDLMYSSVSHATHCLNYTSSMNSVSKSPTGDFIYRR